jgi:hypothetical protein
LSWLVPTLGTVLVTLFGTWYQQSYRKRAPTPRPVVTRQDSISLSTGTKPRRLPEKKVTVLVPNGLRQDVSIDSNFLVEARKYLEPLCGFSSALFLEVKDAIDSYGPNEDWRMLLAVPRCQLDDCKILLEQLHQLPHAWATADSWIFEFIDTLEAAQRTATELDDAIEESIAGVGSTSTLANSASQLDNFVRALADLAERADEGS